MPGLLYLTVLSTRMWNVADEVSLTPNYTGFFFFFFTGSCHTLDWGRGGKKKKKTGFSTWRRGHRWQWTNGDVSQVVAKNRGLVLAVASCGDKFCTVAANSGQTVVVADSWRAQGAENSPAISLNKHHNSFFCPRAVPWGIGLNATWRWWAHMVTSWIQHTHTHPSASVPPAHPCRSVLSQ